MRCLLSIAAVLCLVCGEDVRVAFRKALAKFGGQDHINSLSESEAVRRVRFQSFTQFHARVVAINKDDTRPFTAEDNFLSILTPEERHRRLGHNVTEPQIDLRDIVSLETASDTEVPKQRDFSTVLPDIKNQGDCGSCWTFAATASLEGEIYFKTGRRKISLSEQEYMECSTRRNGCKGGLSEECYMYTRAQDRIAPTSAYPFTGKDSRTCHAAGKPNALLDNNVKVMGDMFMTKGGNAALVQWASQHIVAVALYANTDFQAYSTGIYTDTRCQRDTNHEVVVVGYGKRDGKLYWKVRNSWGPDWGVKGHIFMDREVEDLCRITSKAHVPRVVCREGATCTAPDPDDGDTAGDVCYKSHSLSGCKDSRDKAVRVCEKSGLSPDKCIIVKQNNKCYMGITDNKVSGSVKTVEVAYLCDKWEVAAEEEENGGKCNIAGGMVLCSDCNCCKHVHFCDDPAL